MAADDRPSSDGKIGTAIKFTLDSGLRVSPDRRLGIITTAVAAFAMHTTVQIQLNVTFWIKTNVFEISVVLVVVIAITVMFIILVLRWSDFITQNLATKTICS